MLALALTLVSSLNWAGFDLARKLMVRRVDVLVVACIVNLAQLPGFVAWAGVAGHLTLDGGYWPFAAASIGLNLAANVMFLSAIRRSELSMTIPLLGLTPAFALLFGALALDERPTTTEQVGIVTIAIGAMGLTAAPRDWRRPWRLLVAPLGAPGSLLMIGVAVCWSMAPFFDKLALRHAGTGLHGAILSAGVGLALALGVIASRSRTHIQAAASQKGLFFAGGVLALLALGCQLWAVQLMFVSLFEGLKRAIGIGASVALGRLFLGEPVTPQKLLSVASMTLGVLLLV